jgi:hypothetical protein
MFNGTPGSYDVCKICFWEDDIVQLAFPDMAGGANNCSLIQGQMNFIEFGACERKFLNHVRPPGSGDTKDQAWRLIDPRIDRFLNWEKQEDHSKWKSVKEANDIWLYYWREEYWLSKAND